MRRYVDLSVTVSDATMSPPSTNMKLEVTPHRRGPGFWQVSSVRQSLHTGAHIDSPLHVFKDGITTAEISLEQVMGEALVVDMSHVGANQEITIDDLKRGGADGVKEGDIVLLRTDWTDKMYGTWPDYFVQSPYCPPATAEWLVAKGAKNIGFDFFEEYCARLPDFSSEDFPMHRVILGAGVVIMEGLTNLGALPRRRVDRAAVALGLVLLLAPAAAVALASEDAFVAGYAAAILERDFKLTAPSLRVENGVISVEAADLAGADRARVVAALQAIRGVARVEVLEPGMTPSPPPASEPTAPTPPLRVLSEWQSGLLPGGSLFKPLIADPRWPHFAASYQRHQRDPQLVDVAAVSFGETFSLYRDRLGRGWWEVGVQAGVFAVFDLDAFSKDLVNADYLVAFPLSYRYADFSAMFRLFHQSSHLGDEFLLRTKTARVNLSYESVDAKVSYEFGDLARIYAGTGYLFDQDPPHLKPWSIQYGLEYTSPWPARDKGWRPVAGVDLQHREENAWSVDFSARAGMQLLIEYFNGRSPNGQFYREKIEYIGLGTHFHF